MLGLASKTRRVNHSEGWVSSIARGVVGEYVLGLVAAPPAAITQIVVRAASCVCVFVCVRVCVCVCVRARAQATGCV